MNDDKYGCLAAILAFSFIGGNAFLFTGALNEDLSDNGFAWLMVIIAVIADIALAIWLLSAIGKAVGSSYGKSREKSLKGRKETVVKEIGNKISHKNEIQQAFDKYFEKLERDYSLVSLITSCMGNNSQELETLFFSSKEDAFANAQKEIFRKLSKGEKERFPKNVDEVIDYRQILEQEVSELKTDLCSVATSDEDQLSAIIKKHCPELHKSINRKRIKLITKIVIPIVIIVTLVCSFNFIKNIPYRELHSMIEDQTLTIEMLDWDSRKDDSSYYDYIHSEKGYKFLASELTKLHRDNDIKKAMWLLCVQPNCINGIDLCASDSFIDWVVDYGRENGSQKTDSKGNTTYSVDGYEISISSIFDYSLGHYFEISDGQNEVSVERKNSFHEGQVPTIQ